MVAGLAPPFRLITSEMIQSKDEDGTERNEYQYLRHRPPNSPSQILDDDEHEHRREREQKQGQVPMVSLPPRSKQRYESQRNPNYVPTHVGL